MNEASQLFCPRCLTGGVLEFTPMGKSAVASCESCGLFSDGTDRIADAVRYVCFANGVHFITGIPVLSLGEVSSYRAHVYSSAHYAGIIPPPSNGEWTVSNERVGYAGFRKSRMARDRNLRYGEGNWKIVHRLGDILLDPPDALSLYETAYIHFFIHNHSELDHICAIASDVYDYSENNIRSGFSYDMTGEKASHFQDVAVRRAVRALGRTFEGQVLVQIRGRDSTGYFLNPGLIPFHLPGLIRQPEEHAGQENVRIWWNKGSIESFWQNNKLLLYKEQ